MYHEWLCVAEADGPAQLYVCARGMSAIWFLYVAPDYINIPTSAFALIPASFKYVFLYLQSYMQERQLGSGLWCGARSGHTGKSQHREPMGLRCMHFFFFFFQEGLSPVMLQSC